MATSIFCTLYFIFLLIYVIGQSLVQVCLPNCRPVERGEGGFPGPSAFGGQPSLKNTEKGVPDGFFLTSNVHNYDNMHFGRGSAPDLLGELTTLPRPLVDGEGTPLGHPHVSSLSISVHTE